MNDLTIKNQAKILQAFLKQNNTAITYSSCLQAVAKMYGFKDWNTFSAQLKKQETMEDNFVLFSDSMETMSKADLETFEQKMFDSNDYWLRTQKYKSYIWDHRNKMMEDKQLFLEAWKEGVYLAGEEFFIIKNPVYGATEKEELSPDYEAIKRNLFKKSTGQSLFLAVMYSFYDREEGQNLLSELGYPNFVNIFYRLEPEHIKIVMKLLTYYNGW